jgi:protein-S-isoprenylcysteine O-methyltransferase Ste14
MPTVFWIIDAAWFAWAVTWMALAAGNKKILRREDALSRVLHIAPLFIAAALFVAGHGGGQVLAMPILPRAAWFGPVGAVMVLCGLLFAVWARLTIGGNWSGVVTLKQDHQLVTSGPYRLVRHPIYTGLLFAMIGNVAAFDAWGPLLAFVIVLVAFLRKMKTEERFMMDAFGPIYAAYSARTPALVPGAGRLR